MSFRDVLFDKDSVFLVTGGAGFIGSNVAIALAESGYEVRVMDDLSTGHLDNIRSLQGSPKFTFWQNDIRDYKACEEITKGVDYVIHLAAWGSVPRSIERPLLYEDINIRGTLNMMEASRQNKVKRFAYASSSSVYGDSIVLPKVESHEGKVLSPYALTKRVNEEYGRLYKELYALNTFGMRFFNVFGRHQDPNSKYAAVIPKFIKQLINGETPTIYGDGRQSRDFTYVDNVVEGCLRCCAASEEFSGETYNIGAGGREYLIDVYNEICDVLGIKKEPNYASARIGDIRDSNADISKARIKIGYDPQYDFATGIRLAIDWYKGNV